jgi:hypothetical protein
MDPFFGSDPMLIQYLEHRSTWKTAYTFPYDALGNKALKGVAEGKPPGPADWDGKL